MAITTCPPDHRELVDESFVLSVDLGQAVDPTAIALLHHKTIRHQRRRDGHTTLAGETIDVVHLQRLPLGLSYPEQAAEVGRLVARPPLTARNCELVIDATGVGRAVSDIFHYAGMTPIQVTITSGDNATATGLNRWSVPKAVLISLLDARLHLGDLRIAAELTEAGALAEELKEFRRKVSAAGRFQYEARVGKHDDLVLAVAIGLWICVGRPKPPVAAFGVYSNSIPSPHRQGSHTTSLTPPGKEP